MADKMLQSGLSRLKSVLTGGGGGGGGDHQVTSLVQSSLIKRNNSLTFFSTSFCTHYGLYYATTKDKLSFINPFRVQFIIFAILANCPL